MQKIERYLSVAGIAVLLSFFASWFQLGHASYDTGWRDLGRGGMAAGGVLDILCAVAGLVVLIIRRRQTSIGFRIVFLFNALLAGLLIWDIVKDLR